TKKSVPRTSLDHAGSAAGAEVIHEAHVGVGEVDEIGVPIAACDEYRVDAVIGDQQVVRLFERQDRRSALLTDVVGVGPGGPYVVGKLDACCPHRVLLVLLGDGDDDVHGVGGHARVCQRSLGSPNP